MGSGGSISSSMDSSKSVIYGVEPESNEDSFYSVGRSSTHSKTQEFQTFFDADRPEALSMFTGSRLCVQKSSIKEAFFKYITEFGWVDEMMNESEMHIHNPYSEDHLGAICFNNYCMSVRNCSQDMHDYNGLTKAQIVQRLKINDSKDLDSFQLFRSDSKDSCLQKQQLNPFVIAGLWSYFQKTPEFKKLEVQLQHEEHLHPLSRSRSSGTLKVTFPHTTEGVENDRNHFAFDMSRGCAQMPVTPIVIATEGGGKDLLSPATTPLSSTCHTTPSGTVPGSPLTASVVTTPSVVSSSGNLPTGRPSPSKKCTPKGNSISSRSNSSSGNINSTPRPEGLQRVASPSSSMRNFGLKKHIRDVYFQAVEDRENQHFLAQALTSGSWTRDLVRTLDNHPRSITIADARVHSRGFPLLYVNKAFESLSLYSRAESLGRGCGQLLSSLDHTESDQVQLLSDSLRNGMSCKVALTNQRKDGTVFLNLVATLPVHNAEGDLVYIIGVQYDASHVEASLRDIKVIDDLLRMIALVLK